MPPIRPAPADYSFLTGGLLQAMDKDTVSAILRCLLPHQAIKSARVSRTWRVAAGLAWAPGLIRYLRVIQQSQPKFWRTVVSARSETELSIGEIVYRRNGESREN